ncbi:MAG: hypothetical protein ABIJ57_00080 [Pseudomonadota bacterium]
MPSYTLRKHELVEVHQSVKGDCVRLALAVVRPDNSRLVFAHVPPIGAGNAGKIAAVKAELSARAASYNLAGRIN